MTLIDLKNIYFSYIQKFSDNDFCLENINISFKKGDFISILGPNGSGKSTLLKIIARLLRPTKGQLFYTNIDYKEISPKNISKRIAFVPQSTFSIYPFSVFEIVMMGRTPYLNYFGFEKKKDIEIVNNTLELVGIVHLKNKGINEISGGEAQRDFITQALVQKPEVILLDEPNAHLDIEHQMEIFTLLNLLNENENLTVIAVSHDLNLAGLFSKRVMLMKKGNILMDSDKKTILTESNLREIFNVNSMINYDEKNEFLFIN